MSLELIIKKQFEESLDYKNIIFTYNSFLPNELYLKSIISSSFTNDLVLDWHWQDIDKKQKDFIEIHNISYMLVPYLTSAFNQLFSTNYPERYWKIRLYPWLLSFISTTYDRWETISTAINLSSKINSNGYYDEEVLIYDTLDFTQLAAFSETFNTILLTKILEYRGIYVIKENTPNDFRERIKSSYDLPSKRFKSLVIDYIIQFFQKFKSRKLSNQSFFYTDIPLSKSILKLFSFDQIRPTYYRKSSLKELKKYKDKFIDIFLHSTRNINFEDSKIKFIFSEISNYIPMELFENTLLAKNLPLSLIPIGKHYINSSISLWYSPYARSQAALSALNDNILLITSEHGGSIPVCFEQAEAEVEFSDVRNVFAKEFNIKHKRVKPNIPKRKLNLFNQKKLIRLNQDISILCILPSISEFTYRCSSQIAAPQFNLLYASVLKLVSSLNSNSNLKFTFRPGPSDSPLHRNIIQSLSNIDLVNISTSSSISTALDLHDMSIIFYPETTVLDAIESNKPFLIYSDPEIYKFHPQFLSFVENLVSIKLLHYSYQSIFEFLENISIKRLSSWWNSDKISQARDLFQDNCLIK